jgi:choline kinase
MLDALILIPEITKGMKSIGSKALLPIKKQITVLGHQIASLKKIDKNIHITVATGFESDKVYENFRNIPNISFIYNAKYRNTNETASLLLYLEKYDPNNLLIIKNGILLKENALPKTYLTGGSKVFILDKQKENETSNNQFG